MRETYCGKCQGMVNGNGCDAKDCEVNEGKPHKAKPKAERKETDRDPAPVNG